jgi:hypothetical protein
MNLIWRERVADHVGGVSELKASAGETCRIWMYANAKGDDGESAVGQKKNRHGVALKKRREVMNQRGRMSVGERVRCRVRYFTDGAILGIKTFVAEQRDEASKAPDEGKSRRINSIPELEKSAAIFSLRKLRINGVMRTPLEASVQ